MVVSRQRIGKRAYNCRETVESGVFSWVRPVTLHEDPRPAELIIERYLRDCSSAELCKGG
jgi:hypothetical protein